MRISHLIVCTATMIAGAALAQSPAPAAGASAAPTSGVATASCPKPDAHPGRLASDNARRGWGREVQAWTECMKKYIKGVQDSADEAVKNANAAVARSNAAINEYNAAVKEFQAQTDASAN